MSSTVQGTGAVGAGAANSRILLKIVSTSRTCTKRIAAISTTAHTPEGTVVGEIDCAAGDTVKITFDNSWGNPITLDGSADGTYFDFSRIGN